MSIDVIRLPAADSLRIRFSMTEDREVVPLEGYTIAVLVKSTPEVSVTQGGGGSSTVITIPRGSIATPGVYDAEISADNGSERHTRPFKLLVDEHP